MAIIDSFKANATSVEVHIRVISLFIEAQNLLVVVSVACWTDGS